MDTSTGQRKSAAAIAAATAAVGSAAPAIFAESADAARPADTCPGNTFCMWENARFVLPVEWDSPTGSKSFGSDGYDSHPSVPLNNTVSSAWNNSNRWIKLCDQPSCAPFGYGLCFAPGGAAPELQQFSNWASFYHSSGGDPGLCSHYITAQGCSM